MKSRRSTRQALLAAIEMAAAPPGAVVTAAGVAARHGLPPAVVAKIFQRLARVGLAIGTRGVAGGYRLSRPAAEITVLEVFESFERLGSERPVERVGGVHAAERRLGELVAEIDQLARATLASVSLATLVGPRRALVPRAASLERSRIEAELG